MTAHPKYPNDPLALVLIELRHPRTEPPVPSAISILKEELARWTPILEQEEVRQVNLETGEHTAHSQKKLVARDRRTAITFRPDAMTLEVTDYPGWEEFRSIVHAMVTARQDVAPVDGCIRIGLRYINEIRASLAEPSGWAYWVAESLLGPGTQLADLKLTTTAQRHVIQCEGPEPGDSLTLRYALSLIQL
ncbi:TIGR04255 family protein [Mycobacterium tuberculosis]|uniref:TIGR04255 family protein n=1 Tax=Mycobacterium tuberculosis TaxID=1773 RepID=UPI00207AE7E3|nr:TIGR04255 family protein [Mycobacterium tuberculosis]